MHTGKLVFAQLMEHAPRHTFRRCVAKYPGKYPTLSFSHRDQFLCMVFAQLTFRESLRAHATKLYHLGIRGGVARSTLADANEKRDWRSYRDFALALIEMARRLYANDGFGVELEQTVYALDSTTIDLCLALFPWAPFRTHKAGCFYVMDRGYIDFARLCRVHLALAFFVIRAKSNLQYRRVYSRPIDKTTGLRCDQTIILTGVKTARDYPIQLRRVKFYDAEHDKLLVFLTNNFALPALTIAQLYRCRWQVELFFKWIKQHLRIKAFFGTSENAVKTQVWIAISAYVLVAIVKKRLAVDASLYTILQVLSLTLFEKTPLIQLLNAAPPTPEEDATPMQLNLFS